MLDSLGTLEIVFLSLWAVFGTLYWLNYRKTENPLGALLKVACLLGFVWAVMKGFDWLAHPVPPEQAYVFWGDEPTEVGPRVPLLADAFMWFAIFLVALVCWYARKKVGTVAALMLSTWDRGHWYVLPVLFVLMTIGLVLVAAAASPVLSPFIYTLF
ncbi:MAG: DUF5989 family protein [Planctomycetota bacterium]|jgi:hypothetical protein